MEHNLSDYDLEYLARILRHMPAEAGIPIGLTSWMAFELRWIVNDAQELRALRAAGRIT